MKKIIGIISILVLLTKPVIAVEHPVDWYIHAGGSATITAVAHEVGATKFESVLIGFGVGLAKEVFMDSRISGSDLIADAIGCVIGVSIPF